MKVDQLKNVKDTGQCVGCTACASVCPKDAIKLNSSGLLGFYTPTIDLTSCVNCGLCVKVCSILNEKESRRPQKAYYGWAINEEVRRQSSSGGAFFILAKQVLNEKGVVFGAAYDSNLKKVVHTSTDSVPLERLIGSKYVQSDLCEVFVEVKKNLEDKRLTLFVGTPCQVSGLISFLGDIDITDLITCDFICHGVPGPYVFSEYIQIIEKKIKSSVINYSFRNKKRGWRNSSTEIIFENGKKINHANVFDMYFQGFIDDLFLNESCYMCKMDNVFNADIRLSDFWGYSSFGIQNDEKGMSLLLVQTQKGDDFIRKIENEVFFKELPVELANRSQNYTQESHKKNYEKHKKFIESVKSCGIKVALSKNIGNSAISIFLHKLQRFGIKKIFKRIANRFKK